MEIFTNHTDLAARRFENTAVTIGVFDGVHRGHAEVLRRLREASERRTASVLVTFDRHPLSVTHPEIAPPLLMTLDEKLRVIEEFGVDAAVVERFTRETASIGYDAYIARRLAGDLGMRHLVVGHDFHLGRDREGSEERLVSEGRRLGFDVSIVPPVLYEGHVVSSTTIRSDISARRLEHAERLLTRPYFFEATVVPGEGIGRTIGFPTANLSVDDERKLLPPRGVYAVLVEAGTGRYGGMMNIGRAPTVREDAADRIEAHLFDFSGGLAGARLRIHCIAFVREERRFAGAEELQAQLMQDERSVRDILEKKR